MIISFSASSSTVLQHAAGSVKTISGHKNFPTYLLNRNGEKKTVSQWNCLLKYSSLITESQNHRIVGVGRDLCGSVLIVMLAESISGFSTLMNFGLLIHC